MANIYLSSVGWTAVTPWAATTAYVSTSNGGRGDYRRQLAAPSINNERVFRCTTSGTSGGTEPSWNLTKNATTTSGTAVFTECTGQEADQVAGTWRAPHARLRNAFFWGAAGDTFYLDDKHIENPASYPNNENGPGTDISPCRMFCVTPTGSIPPVAADLRKGALIGSSNGGVNNSLGGAFSIIYGVSFQAGTTFVFSPPALLSQRFVECEFLNAQGGSGGFGAGQAIFLEFERCNIGLGGAWNVGQGDYFFRDCTFDTSLYTSLSPGAGIVAGGSAGSNFFFEGCDFSKGTGTSPIAAIFPSVVTITVVDCKLNSGGLVPSSGLAISSQGGPFQKITGTRCSDADGQLYRSEKHSYYGALTTDIVSVRTGGSVVEGTSVSHKVVTGIYTSSFASFRMITEAIYNTVVDSLITVTVEGLADPRDFTALPLNDEVWIDVEYSGRLNSTLGSYRKGSKLNPLTTGVSHLASTSAWDSKATARANSTAYTAGAIRKVASNAGRLFICTTAGTSSGSEPGGYASAVDGGSVTDGTATFKAMWRFKMVMQLGTPMPKNAGVIYATPVVGKASLNGVYVDPKITLS